MKTRSDRLDGVPPPTPAQTSTSRRAPAWIVAEPPVVRASLIGWLALKRVHAVIHPGERDVALALWRCAAPPVRQAAREIFRSLSFQLRARASLPGNAGPIEEARGWARQIDSAEILGDAGRMLFQIHYRPQLLDLTRETIGAEELERIMQGCERAS